MRLSPFSAGLSTSQTFSSTIALTIATVLFFSTVFAAPAPSPIDEPPTPVVPQPQDGKADATNSAKILLWLIENVDLDSDKGVFYSGSTGASSGETMARNFCQENEEDGYKYFYDLFDADWQEAFGGAEPAETPAVAAACSEAMAEFVTGEVRVFNHQNALDTSYWSTIEFPALLDNGNVNNIWDMADSTLDPNNHPGGNLKASTNGNELHYEPGQCGVHVKQYQKNEATVNPNPNYKFDITIYDALQHQIGQVLFADAPTAVGVDVDSLLPYVLIVTAGPVDSSNVGFAYAGANWDSSSGQCSVGGYDSGSRQMDCGFACPALDGETSDVKRLVRKTIDLS